MSPDVEAHGVAEHGPERGTVDDHAHHVGGRVDAVALASAAGTQLRLRGQVGDARADDVAQDGRRCPRGSPMTKSGCGEMPRYSMTTATGRPAVEGHAPAGARELGVVEVGDGVGREEPVLLQEGEQQLAVARGADLQPARGGSGPIARRWSCGHRASGPGARVA